MFNRGMENKEIRRANLLLLVDKTQSKTIKELADRCDVSVAYLSHVKTRIRGMGDDVARRLERGMKKGTGWMDIRHDRPSDNIEPTEEEINLIRAYRDCDRDDQETILGLCQKLRRKP